MTSQTLHHHSFPSMGTEVELLLTGRSEQQALEAFAEARELAREWNRIFSRFLPESELSQLNAAAGKPLAVSTPLFDAIGMAVHGSCISAGLFNPLILPTLIAHGYDRDFHHMASDNEMPVAACRPPRVEAVVLDPRQRLVQIPPGSALDLGGIVKGLYADTLADRLAGWDGGIVSAGGDMRIWGEGPDDGRWMIGVEDPASAERDVATVTLSAGGIATSGTNRRTWRRGAETVHHLIDPRTGRPARSPRLAVTAIAPTAALAEIGSTALFIDPVAAADSPLPRTIWASLAAGHDCQVAFAEYEWKAPIDVILAC